MKILLAEDNEDNYEVVRTNLKKLKDCELRWAKNGIEALEMLDEGFVPNLFLIDVEMPLMNGLELIQNLKANIKYNTIPIIVVTASIFAEMKSSYFAIGANEVLEKPFSRSELLNMIAKYAK